VLRTVRATPMRSTEIVSRLFAQADLPHLRQVSNQRNMLWS
jgi:hypothetical protein